MHGIKTACIATLYNYRYSKENKLPSPSENQKYNNAVKNAEEEIIRRGKYHIGKNEVFTRS